MAGFRVGLGWAIQEEAGVLKGGLGPIGAGWDYSGARQGSAAADRRVELGRDVSGHVRLRRDQARLVELGDQFLL